jgi:hypothetical protein
MLLNTNSRLNTDPRPVGQGFRLDNGPRKLTAALQAAEGLIRAVGRGFIPGKKPIESTGALAPEVCFLGLPKSKPCLLAAFGSEGGLAR